MEQETLFLFQTKQSLKYLLKLIPTAWQAYMTKHNNSISHPIVKHDYFKNSFFLSTIIEFSTFQETYIGFHKTLLK